MGACLLFKLPGQHSIGVYFINNADEIAAPKTILLSVSVAFFISVALGVGMSYFTWMARELLSAASFSIVRNICRILTIVINFYCGKSTGVQLE